MAAIIDPHRHAPVGPQRPALRLVTADDGRSALVPVELGLRTAHLVAAVAAFAVLLLLSLAIGNGALAGLAPGPSQAGTPAAAAGAPTVEAQPGDTLWTIAQRLQPEGDVRALVDQLVALNGATALQPGQEILLPG